MSEVIRERRERLVTAPAYLRLKGSVFGLIALSGVEFYESSYSQDFSLTRTEPAEYGPFDALLDRVRIGYDNNPSARFESILLQIAHKGIRGNEAIFISGTKLAVTVIDGAVRHAWIDNLIPFCKERIPEAPPLFGPPRDDREEFTEWEHEFDVRHTLDEATLNLVLAEVHLIAST